MHDREALIAALADLTVRLGANVQPGQIVSVRAEPGQEPVARAIAEAAYRRGARFVELRVFDVYFKRARVMNASPDTLGFVPPWYGERELALGEHRAAIVSLTGPAAPDALDGADPALVGRDLFPRVKERLEVLNARTTNWARVPCPSPGWAGVVHPDLEPDAALALLWDEIAHACRLDTPDPIAAWEERFAQLVGVAGRLDELRLDRVRFKGPGTDLTVGLLDSSAWRCAQDTTVAGVIHAPNLPTEEVFTTPDPERVEGVVRSTKPLSVSGALLDGIRVRFEGGRAVEIDADRGAETLRALARRDPGAGRLGEVALVDRESRLGSLGTVFFTTLLDENAASHIALGQGFEIGVESDEDVGRLNRSRLHIDFMIGSDEVAVTGVARGGEEVPLMRAGAWQL